jgi:hypothetical protein
VPSFSFAGAGQNVTKEPEKPSFSFGGKSDQKPADKPFGFGAGGDKPKTDAPFSFGATVSLYLEYQKYHFLYF